MPKITQINEVLITPERFLNACSPEELQEIELLIQKPHYQDKMDPEQEPAPEPSLKLKYTPDMMQIFNCSKQKCSCASKNKGYPHPDCAHYVED